MRKIITLLAAVLASCATLQAQSTATKIVKVGGVIRGKYEYQTDEGKGRFQVRTARVNVSGQLNSTVGYKAEIDLCDEGKIKMLDAYTRLSLFNSFKFTIGQKRVPFTIDAHRSPSEQYFANRSFIAKQVGNIRDVGAEMEYTFHPGFPIQLRAGVFNGSGLTNQKDFWTNNINFSSRVVAMLPIGLDIEMSIQKIKPERTNILMLDMGASYHRRGFIAEAEFLYKRYANHTFRPVKAFNGFVSYDIPISKGVFTKASPLIRYDYMSDHSDGKRYLDGKESTEGSLIVNDCKRSRITGGVTLSMDKPFLSDIRINYEKYFYGHDGVAKTSEKDKFVVEFMTRF